jgi:cell division protein FtsL
MANDSSSTNKSSKRVFIAPLILLLGIGYIGFLLYQVVFVNYQTNQKISSLESQLRQNREDKGNLETLIGYYKTSSFQELEARKKLGLKLPGEKVVKIDLAEETKPSAIKPAEPVNTNLKKTNLENWIDYLFYPDL